LAFMAKTEDDLQGLVSDANTTLEAAHPGFTFTYAYKALINLYVCLDAENVLKICQLFNVSNIAGTLYEIATKTQQPIGQLAIKVATESPRSTGWSNPVTGEKHDAPPSDKKGAKGQFGGAAQLIDAAKSLLVYADALRASGQIRSANIVKYAYDNIFNGTWTITEAFDYLRRNNLA